jgi:Na+/melibiose symporter-like transporter
MNIAFTESIRSFRWEFICIVITAICLLILTIIIRLFKLKEHKLKEGDI